MAHYVKCFICGKEFNRDKIEYVQKGRRYAHVDCVTTEDAALLQEKKDLEELEKYILHLLQIETITDKIKKQINKFKKEKNYTYSGILKTLKWYYDIKGNTTDKANGGIGIVPYIYQEACDYYYKLYLAQIVNEDKDLQEYKKRDVVYIEIKSPRVRTKEKKMFDLGEEEYGI